MSAGGLHPLESQVLALWDDGRTIEQITAALGRKRRHIQKIISHYDGDDRSANDAMVRAGSRLLAAAIARTGGRFL